MRSTRFLIVDESRIIKNAVANTLINRLGCGVANISTAQNGRQALDILQTVPIDIVICEWQISGLDGQEVLKQVRQNSMMREMPFIMMSTQGEKEAVVTSIANGVSQYLVKPFSPEKLEDVIRKAWNGARKRTAQRYSGLPKHVLKAKFSGGEIQAQVVDISRTGGLATMVYDPAIRLFDVCRLSLEFDDIDDVGLVTITDLPAQILRIEVSRSFHYSTKKCDVAMVFGGEKVTKDVQQQIDKLIDFLAEKEKSAYQHV